MTNYETKQKCKIPWRKNVLLLVAFGYISLLLIYGGIFVLELIGKVKFSEVSDLLFGALMALIGGSLALGKDLIPLGDSESNGG